MNIIDRFTRDDASAKVWWPFALLLFVLFLLTFPAQNLVVERDRKDAAAWVGSNVQDVAARLVDMSLDEPIPDADAGGVMLTAQETLLAHPLVQSVRVWAPDGRLLLSTDPSDTIGSSEYLNDESLGSAVGAGGAPSWVVSTTSLSDVPSPPTLEVYVSVAGAGSSAGIVEVRIPDGPMLSGLRSDWRSYRLIFGLASALVFLLAGLSMREPLARIGAGVRFYRESVPRNLAVIDHDEEIELRQSGSVARSRVTGMEGRLRESESARLALEGKLQIALSELAMRPRRVAAPPAEKPAAKKKPEPVAVAIPEPVAVAIPEPVAAQEPVSEPADEGAVFVIPEVEAPKEEQTSQGADWLLELQVEAGNGAVDDVVVIPEPASDRDETAVEVLNRLVEPVGSGVEPEADSGELRSRLARTAALKKPGSRSEERFRGLDDPPQ